MNLKCSGVETNHGHFLDKIVFPEKRIYLLECDPSGPLNGKPVSTGADGRKGDGLDLIFLGQLETIPITTCQQFFLSVVPASPNGTHRMDDPLCRQAIALGDLGVAGLTTP
jgi:hypothetical protein